MPKVRVRTARAAGVLVSAGVATIGLLLGGAGVSAPAQAAAPTTPVAGQTAAPGAPAAPTVKIMPLGDSITASPGCWRKVLWSQLQASAYTHVDFVGSQSYTGDPLTDCYGGGNYDGDHEGHAGLLATDLAAQKLLPGWLAAAKPDVVLLELGTSDVLKGVPTWRILSAYSTLVGQIRAADPASKILVAQLTPVRTAACGSCSRRIRALNAVIPYWAATLTTEASPIKVVNQFTGFNAATDTVDGVLPNSSGDQKIATAWYAGLETVLPPPIRPIGSCQVSYDLYNQQPGGYQANITVTNIGRTPLTGWLVKWTLADSDTAHQEIGSQIYGANVSVIGTAVTASNLLTDSPLARNASTTFTVLGSWSGANPTPTPICVAA